jgi:hypothetical protein
MASATNSVDSDEAYDPRLQAVEMGVRMSPADAQTLIRDGDQASGASGCVHHMSRQRPAGSRSLPPAAYVLE